MIILRVLKHEDYEDVKEICKDIWDGTDYLPSLFHGWVDAPQGCFMGAVDTDTGKVIGTSKYSVLGDGSGWLEGMRVHKDYRGRKLAKLLTESVLTAAKEDLAAGKISRIAFSTHISNVESVNMMKQYGFVIEQQHILALKEFEHLSPDIKASDFDVKPWDISYKEFVNLPFTRRRDGIFHIAFCFEKPSRKFFEYLKEHDCFVIINGYRGIYLFKGEPHFVTEEESFEAIDTFMSYYLSTLKEHCNCCPFFSVMQEDQELIQKLQESHFTTWTDWQSDYFYFVWKP